MRFKWDAAKAAANVVKHGITFEEASTVFADELSLTYPDPDSQGEARFLIFGRSLSNRELIVVHVEGNDTIRIISARRLTQKERRDYEQLR